MLTKVYKVTPRSIYMELFIPIDVVPTRDWKPVRISSEHIGESPAKMVGDYLTVRLYKKMDKLTRAQIMLMGGGKFMKGVPLYIAHENKRS